MNVKTFQTNVKSFHTNVKTFDISIKTIDLAKAINRISSIVERRNVIPVFNNIKLEAKGNNLVLTATDMTLSVIHTTNAIVKEEGCITVSCQMLLDIIKKIPAETSDLKLISNLLEIKSSNCKFHLNTIDSKEFPTLLEGHTSTNLTIGAKDIIHLLEYTKFSISTEETRSNLCGVSIESSDNKLTAISMDGHRISIASKSIINNIEINSFILPKKSAIELIKIFTDPNYINSNINISLGRNFIKCVAENIIINSKLIDAKFPDYKAFIPRDNNNILNITKSTIAGAIDRVDTISVNKIRSIKISISKKFIEFRASDDTHGRANETIELNQGEYNGEQITIGFNPKYLIDIFSTTKEEEISIQLKDSISPVLIKAGSNNLFIVMPVRV